ncbi:hypothetical protein CF319_g4568 [Tilletia indica]|nr:hypothetical protein CF319_g4568 [Tilletia indica]
MTSRNAKYPTHLAITTDLIFGPVESTEFSHKVESTLFDAREEPFEANTYMWARNPPKEGAYQAIQCPFAPTPMRINVNDKESLRNIPESMDGTNPENESLMPIAPFVSGIGAILEVDSDKKKGKIGGLVFFNRQLGWIEWQANISFEESLRWLAWMLPAPRTLVSFDGILDKVRPDGTMDITLRRITTLDSAPQALLVALKIGNAAGGDRAVRIRQARADAAAKAKRKVDDDDVFTETPLKAANDNAPGPSAPKADRKASTLGPPSSPTPAPPAAKTNRPTPAVMTPVSPTVGLQTRKKARAETPLDIAPTLTSRHAPDRAVRFRNPAQSLPRSTRSPRILVLFDSVFSFPGSVFSFCASVFSFCVDNLPPFDPCPKFPSLHQSFLLLNVPTTSRSPHAPFRAIRFRNPASSFPPSTWRSSRPCPL